MSDLYDFIPEALPANGAVKVGDNAWTWVETHLGGPASPTEKKVVGFSRGIRTQIAMSEERLHALRKLLAEQSKTMLDLDVAVSQMISSLYQPGTELAEAQKKIDKLERQRDGLIREARRQKARADKAEKVEVSPDGYDLVFLRRTPGGAIRYLSRQVMARTGDDMELAGIAMAMRMVADDVDRLPQGNDR